MEVGDLAVTLGRVPGVLAVVLGGSRARGMHTPSSDTDVGLYYSSADPLDLDALRSVVHELDASKPDVTDFYAWGPWVNGGSWTTIEGIGAVDLLYRNVDQVDATIDRLQSGEREHDWLQQPPLGFTSVTYGGELFWCVPLVDDGGVVARLKERVAVYPEPLRGNLVDRSIGAAEFSVRTGRKVAARGDHRLTIAHVVRVDQCLVQALFALNRVWFVNDKSAGREIEAFAKRPDDYDGRMAEILGGIGLGGLIERMEAAGTLVAEVASLAGDLYSPAW